MEEGGPDMAWTRDDAYSRLVVNAKVDDFGRRGERCGILERAASGVELCVGYRHAMGRDPMMESGGVGDTR